ncbi:hypothetical protein FQN60_013233 [Etheostoma spectabile]|uniref:Uncharacterized protein n=1 Tax=Etheostoma spectabile TaxID=54343 RepID=A0A5J5D586_9PERO|nr:hypothetical protein FQN60_013233 [Etheostoma spectabile]
MTRAIRSHRCSLWMEAEVPALCPVAQSFTLLVLPALPRTRARSREESAGCMGAAPVPWSCCFFSGSCSQPGSKPYQITTCRRTERVRTVHP